MQCRIIVHKGCNHNKDVKDLVGRSEDIEATWEEPLREAKHVKGRTYYIHDSPKDPIIEVQMWQVSMTHENTLMDEGNRC